MCLNIPRTLQCREDTTAVTDLIHRKNFYWLVIWEVCVSLFTVFDIQRLYRHSISMTDIVLMSYEDQLIDLIPPMRDHWHNSLYSVTKELGPEMLCCLLKSSFSKSWDLNPGSLTPKC